MKNILACPRRALRRFGRKESGSITVEAVLWLPLFMAIFLLMVDTSMVFHGQSKILRVIQDANRNMAIGRFTTDTEVEGYINDQLAGFDVTPVSTDAWTDGNVVITTVTVPAGDMQLIGFFNALSNLEIDVASAHILDSADFDSVGTSVTSTY